MNPVGCYLAVWEIAADGSVNVPGSATFSLTVNFSPVVVPLPATGWLLAPALGLMGVMRRKISS